MVKTRSNKSSSGDESTAESEIRTEYSTDFERSADENPECSTATVVRQPTKSQSTPIMGHQRPVSETRRRYPLPVDVHMREAFRPERHDEVHSPKSKLVQNGELLESVAAMKSMMTTFMQAMQGMTETIVSVQCNSALGVTPKPSVKTSQRSWSSKPVVRRRQKRDPDYGFRRSIRRYDSSSDSTSSSEDDHASPTGKSKQNNNRLPIFTGKEKWKVWFNRFEAVAEIHGWNKKEKLAELLPRLQGIAGDFVYDQLPREVTTSYRKLVKELDNRFQEVDTTKIYITKFNNRRQTEKESVQEFAAELKRLFDKGFPNRDKVTRQEDLLRQFLVGLQSNDARIHVELNKEPKTIDEAVYYVIHYQETCRYPQESFDFVQVAGNKRNIRQVQSNLTTHPESKKESFKGRPTNEKRCYNCNEEGHFIRQCPHPKTQRRNNGNVPNRSENFTNRPGQNCYGPQRNKEMLQPMLNPSAPEFVTRPNHLN